jgi:flagellar biosynthesis protein FlhB
MSEDSDAERTEEPTPERRRKAREEGNIARSKDASAIAASAAVLGLIAAAGATALGQFRGYVELSYEALAHKNLGSVETTLERTAEMILLLTLPVALAAAIGGIAIGLAESGLQWNWDLLEPKLERLDPITKLPKLFSPGPAAATTLLTLGRVAAVVFVSYKVLASETVQLARLPQMSTDAALLTSIRILGRVAFWSTGALGLLSVLDYGYSWFRIEKSLMMTRQEIKDEMQQQEGDPKIKARQRQRAREMLKRGIVQEVKRSDVIVANPTHVAVALRYRPQEGAPIVTAKGVDDIAQFIKKVAKDNNIPVVESVQLARALNAKAKVGRFIPMEFFQAVAELLAYVYRLKRRGLRA